jgi:nucleotide-binding universal stress UspA family protein
VDQGHLAAFVDTAGKGQRFIEQTRTLPMFTNILLPVDGSAVLTVTTPWAAYFSRELAVIIPDVVIPQPDYDDKRETIAACILQNVVADAHSARVEVRSLHRCNSDPYRAIIETAEREGCDLIVMGSHRERAFTGALLGSETMKVMTHTSTPVLVYRENE